MERIRKRETLEELRARLFEKIEKATHKLHTETLRKKTGGKFGGLLLQQLETLEELREEMQTMTREELEAIRGQLEQVAEIIEERAEEMKQNRKQKAKS